MRVNVPMSFIEDQGELPLGGRLVDCSRRVPVAFIRPTPELQIVARRPPIGVKISINDVEAVDPFVPMVTFIEATSCEDTEAAIWVLTHFGYRFVLVTM
jgi:hypothetical protein